MKILLSPAKSLNLEDKPIVSKHTQPVFLDQTEILAKRMKKASHSDLKSLMSISDKLAELNYDRFQEFSIHHDATNSRPAIFTFDGDVYDGLKAYELSENDIYRLQDRLRILSGMYGILRPLDLMQAYRLEMGTKLDTSKAQDLYEFWKASITDYLNSEIENDELIVNLASKEYSKAVNTKKLKVIWIETVFKDYKNGKLKIISFYAKKARGYMTNYLAKIDNPSYDDIIKFSEDGYGFSKAETKKEYQPVFVR